MTLVVGIDFDSKALHLCGLPTDGAAPVLHSSPLRRPRDDAQVAITQVSSALAQALDAVRRTRAFAMSGGAGTTLAWKPETVSGIWVERGYGANRNVDFLMGAIYGGIFAAANACAPGIPVRQAHSNHWKKHLGVPGNCRKEIANQAAAALWLDTWPQIPAPDDPNLLDAYGIATYAATL